MLNDKIKADKATFDQAVQSIHELLQGFQPMAIPALEEIVAERKAQLDDITRLSEKSTASADMPGRKRWYVPRTIPGGVWEDLTKRMSEGSLSHAVDSIDGSSDSVMAHLAEPFGEDDRRLGVVVGNVQSGKTANYTAVIAKALDYDYKVIIVLSGLYTNLRRQTQRRLERDLGIRPGSPGWHRLTSVDGDIGRADIKNASNTVDKNDRVLAVVKKNSRRLINLRDFLRSVDPGTMSRTPILIIDDESDQATPDASREGSESPTAINQRMKEIWATVLNGTYVGYTATPFANVLINPNDKTDLYPSDFLNVLPTPRNYFGAEQLFGLGPHSENIPDVIRTVSREELPNLSPRGNHEVENFKPQVTPSLETAIRWFIIGAAVRRTRGHTRKHSTMLIHTTHRVDPHLQMRDEINAFLEPLRERALDGDVKDFREVFHKEMNRAAEFYSGDGPAPTWPSVEKEISNVLRTLKVAVDNSKADETERLNYETGTPQTVIVIGGGTLSRGLTLEGLFVSFFTRTSSTYDTLLQMGRWFGYRDGYEDLQRVWVSPGLDGDYRFLAEVEQSLRLEIERMTTAGETPARIGVRIKEHPGRLQITSANKMKHAERVAVDFEGFQLQPTALEISNLRDLRSDEDRIKKFISDVERFAFDSESSPKPQRLFKDVPSTNIFELLRGLHVHPRYKDLLDETLRWTQDKLPETPWNVVLSSGNGEELYSVPPFAVKTVHRRVQRVEKNGSQAEIEMRNMMGGGDLIADLRILGPLPERVGASPDNKDQLNLREAADGAAGRGLLTIYPISRSSAIKDKNYENLGQLVDELHPGQAPPQLFGIAIVAPFDVNNVIKNKGVLVAVRIDDAEYEIDDEALLADSEEDFEGDSQ